MPAILFKSLLVLIGCLIAADIAGVAVGFVLDVLPFKYKSAALFYVIWFVIGVFCGLIAFNMAGTWASPGSGSGDWSEQPGARRIGTIVVLAGIAVLAALGLFFNAIYWSRGVDGEFFVPDSKWHSIVFLAAVLGGMLLARIALMPKAKPAP